MISLSAGPRCTEAMERRLDNFLQVAEASISQQRILAHMVNQVAGQNGSEYSNDIGKAARDFICFLMGDIAFEDLPDLIRLNINSDDVKILVNEDQDSFNYGKKHFIKSNLARQMKDLFRTGNYNLLFTRVYTELSEKSFKKLCLFNERIRVNKERIVTECLTHSIRKSSTNPASRNDSPGSSVESKNLVGALQLTGLTDQFPLIRKEPVIPHNCYSFSKKAGKITRVSLKAKVLFELEDYLEDDAKSYFADLLLIKSYFEDQVFDTFATIVIGDTDGSIARVIVAGIQAGAISFKIKNKKAGLKVLASLMNREAETAKKCDAVTLIQFQECQDVLDEIKYLMSTLIFSLTKIPLLFIGDILFDRFSVNIDVMFEIIQKLHNNGVIFIRGNHDFLNSFYINQYDSEVGKSKLNPVFGAYATKTKDGRYYNNKASQFFYNAYYDHQHEIIYCHHGIRLNEKGYYETAFGTFHAGTPMELVKMINSQCISIVGNKTQNIGNSCARKAYTFDIFGVGLNNDYPVLGCKVVNSHSGGYKQDRQNQIGFNSRIKVGQRSRIKPSAIFMYYDPDY